jgi:GTP-binding protein
MLVAVVNGDAPDPVAEWQAVAGELQLHDPGLLDRPTAMAVTKHDLASVRDRWPRVRSALRAAGHTPIAVSAHDGTGLGELRAQIDEGLAAAAERAAREPPRDEVRVHRFDPLEAGWDVVAERDGLRVRGRRVEASAARTDFDNAESRERFQRLLERLGIDAELRRKGAAAGTTVRIGPTELEWEDEE